MNNRFIVWNTIKIGRNLISHLNLYFVLKNNKTCTDLNLLIAKKDNVFFFMKERWNHFKNNLNRCLWYCLYLQLMAILWLVRRPRFLSTSSAKTCQITRIYLKHMWPTPRGSFIVPRSVGPKTTRSLASPLLPGAFPVIR